MAVLAALVVFPRLALGLSGFETGVAVMPLVRAEGESEEERLAARIRNTKKLLTLAASIMSVLLVGSSVVATLLIPPEAYQGDGAANGRALAYIAHRDFGDLFGTLYDLATITILWFAGASAMAGLLNLIPRYLPRYGMAPEWARAERPLILIITGHRVPRHAPLQRRRERAGRRLRNRRARPDLFGGVCRDDCDTEPAGAVGLVFAVFAYTTLVNIVERPEGLTIALWFIAAIMIVTSLVSRVMRSTELRASGVRYDPAAEAIVSAAAGSPLRIIANRPDSGLPEEYAREAERGAPVTPSAA